MPLALPELEVLRNSKQPELKAAFEAFSKLLNAVNSLPIISGVGSPEGVIAASAGTIYCRRDPLMDQALYMKSTPTGNTGWQVIPSNASGMARAVRRIGGTTNSATYVKVNADDDQVNVPPNCYQMSFNVEFTGAGSMRIKIGANYSNVLTASGTVVVNGLSPGRRAALVVEALASAGSVTANVLIVETTLLVGSQMVGGVATDASAPSGGGGSVPDPGEGSGEFGGRWGESVPVEV